MRACERVLTAVLVVATGATASPGDGAKHSVSASVSAKAPAIDLLAQVVAASGAVAATLPPQPSSRSAPTLAANAGNAGIANANANANGASNAGQGSPLQSLWSALQSASPCLISCFPSLQGILTNAAIGDQICVRSSPFDFSSLFSLWHIPHLYYSSLVPVQRPQSRFVRPKVPGAGFARRVGGRVPGTGLGSQCSHTRNGRAIRASSDTLRRSASFLGCQLHRASPHLHLFLSIVPRSCHEWEHKRKPLSCFSWQKPYPCLLQLSP
ncbi:hypothetical protein BC830DRAFT_437033 [Chytriomyces sp. MP71]|nr:hypothetical protein BC830DRAFT_437033 [Chytriomyces sp. MP71]